MEMHQIIYQYDYYQGGFEKCSNREGGVCIDRNTRETSISEHNLMIGTFFQKKSNLKWWDLIYGRCKSTRIMEEEISIDEQERKFWS
jgi:hypothetical protein